MKRPLISFILLGCNQDSFVREAIDGAFSQTYSPLEILLSDDCTNDDTYTIMQSKARAYRGPHHLILNRNQRRRFIGGHINRAMQLSHGELIVVAAADDISLPERTQILYEGWEQSQRKATSLHSDFIQISESGEVIPGVIKNTNAGESGTIVIHQATNLIDFIRGKGPVVFGCSHAWSRRLFTTFGDLRENLTHEDTGLAFRSFLLNGLYYIGAPLVKYRLHSSNFYLQEQKERIHNFETVKGSEERRVRSFRNSEILYSNMIMDLKKAMLNDIVASSPLDDALIEAERRRTIYAHKKVFNQMTLKQKIGVLIMFCRNGQPRDLKQLLPRIIPFEAFLGFRLAPHTPVQGNQSASSCQRTERVPARMVGVLQVDRNAHHHQGPGQLDTPEAALLCDEAVDQEQPHPVPAAEIAWRQRTRRRRYRGFPQGAVGTVERQTAESGIIEPFLC